MDTGLTERDIKTIEKILHCYPAIETVFIFGSRAKGSYNSGSDIDLAIMNEGITEHDIIHLKSAFEESDLPYVVDVVLYSSIKHRELKDHIDRAGKHFYERKLVDGDRKFRLQ